MIVLAELVFCRDIAARRVEECDAGCDVVGGPEVGYSGDGVVFYGGVESAASTTPKLHVG